MPFVYLWKIISEVIEVAPNFSKAADITHNGWMAVIFSLIYMLVYFGALMCSHLAAFRVANNMKKDLLHHIARLPVGFADEMGTGRVRRIVTEATSSTETLLAHNLPDMAQAIVTPLAMVVMLFIYDWRFGLACIVPIVLAFMMTSVVPQVRQLYDDMGETVPGITQVLVDVSDFFGNFWWLVLIILVGVVGGCVYAVKRTPVGRKVMDSIKIHVPIFGGLFRKLYVSRFARTAEMMLATGVPMLDSVAIAIDATNNVVVEEEYRKVLEPIKGGKALSGALKDREYMLPLVPQMASIGEESGKIDEMLGKAAQVYENELDTQINNISTMVEPILMVIMAGLIGVVIAGTLLPIYSLVSNVGG